VTRTLAFLAGSLLLAILTAASTAYAQGLDLQVRLDVSSSAQMISRADIQYNDAGGHPATQQINGTHTIFDRDTGQIPASETVVANEGVWSGTLSGIDGQAGHCYSAKLSAHGNSTVWYTVLSDQERCFTAPPPPPRPPVVRASCEEGTVDCPSPIVLNLGRGTYELTGLDDPVRFDLDADGHIDTVSWTKGGEALAFLAADRDGNGTIDDGGELFGNHTLTSSGNPAANGFEALRDFDTNRDGVVDARDTDWRRLLLWIDANHDGIAQPDEVHGIRDSIVTGIDLAYRRNGRQDSHGNTFGFEGRMHTRSGDRACYDIYFHQAH
jgi:hypothetical protein